ncbi:Catalytic alpha amylase domain-containing protein [Desulfonema limicola]|uniref:Catalytic alpha amylase domain-containing protein n=1 Tax=Desulfonema limicola TaxID=45656 RepID=A0A975B704_9BACT|nr:alpha-amylase family glycosyl hydrolase [Desulfonema limicola]QTA79862.1 Catalytic alpha amylase domain-containing protein [Desulfonema limicola]
MANPNMYEINTRVWLRRFDKSGHRARLEDVPVSYWESLALKGFDYIWLMGAWKICESTIEKYCLQEGAIKDSFSEALKDFQVSDLIGSPYAVDRYEINPSLGDNQSIAHLKSILDNLGIKLILDFVPNHFSAHSSLIKTDPYVFLEAPPEFYSKDSLTYYKPFDDLERFFAHGRDPFFPPWEDTVQVNYFSQDARQFMIQTLLDLTDLCSGVRCDVAMLPLNNVFKQTWMDLISAKGLKAPDKEFWETAVKTVKNKSPEFTFIAEVYWDKEWELQQMGFDYTYDKRLTDRLKSGNIKEIKDHLKADYNFQQRSLRFLENHDEERAVKAFGIEKSKAAAVIISTLQGMHFYYDGQFEGKSIRLPVQLGREPEEAVNHELFDFYEKLLSIINSSVFKKGKWTQLETTASWDGDDSYNNILAWTWNYENEKRIIAVNYSSTFSACFIKPDFEKYPDEFELKDVLSNNVYTRSKHEVVNTGLYIKLQGFQSHIFESSYPQT